MLHAYPCPPRNPALYRAIDNRDITIFKEGYGIAKDQALEILESFSKQFTTVMLATGDASSARIIEGFVATVSANLKGMNPGER